MKESFVDMKVEMKDAFAEMRAIIDKTPVGKR